MESHVRVLNVVQSWLVNLPPPSVPPKKQGLIKGLFAIDTPQQGLLSPYFRGVRTR